MGLCWVPVVGCSVGCRLLGRVRDLCREPAVGCSAGCRLRGRLGRFVGAGLSVGMGLCWVPVVGCSVGCRLLRGLRGLCGRGTERLRGRCEAVCGCAGKDHLRLLQGSRRRREQPKVASPEVMRLSDGMCCVIL